MKKKVRTYSGTRSSEVSERELRNRRIARRAAAEGIVLLKNEGVLPLRQGQKAALFGGGAVATVKGGTGSGDVNEREVVSIYQGFLDAGIVLTNQSWLTHFREIYRDARLSWRDMILEKLAQAEGMRLLDVYSSNVFHMPSGDLMKESDFEGADVAFYVISRTAGEAADRFCEEGDYTLTKQEKQELACISEHCKHVAVILNAGGVMDLQDILAIPNVHAILSIVQPGMEGGHAVADVITGKVTPCGKLTDTWAKHYEDYPNAETFSYWSGDVTKELYKEGIYVGYRYFDSFDCDPAYPFGYGLSYTDFSIQTDGVRVHGSKCTSRNEDIPSCGCAEENGAGYESTGEDPLLISVDVTVTNTGSTWSGREVVQIYASCPQAGQEKEFRRLCGFAKTRLLKPGEQEQLTVTFDAKMLASFDETAGAWTLEKGWYGIWAGNSSRNVTLCGVVDVQEYAVLERMEHICPLQQELEQLCCPEEKRMEREQAWHALVDDLHVPVISIKIQSSEAHVCVADGKSSRQETAWSSASRMAKDLVSRLGDEELTAMVIGEVSRGQGQALGAAGIMVPGSAGETSSVLEKTYDVPGVPMADGPAGVRLMKSYEVDPVTGDVYSEGILGTLEGGMFASGETHPGAEIYYQYCTAFPVGTLLAQTWDTALLEEVGHAAAEELAEFGIAWWLAPGMNIHRNPLCGRNFEYYSEDPVISGRMAAAITRGVQSVPGVGTTIKHFACNNQEDNRTGSDSVISERALREIYLRGFEIAVKTSQPMAIMTSYNLINGVHTANSRDLCTQAARNEWGFQGIIMTDWTTTSERGGSTPWKCVWAGNDLIMPGCAGDSESILRALADGSLSRDELRSCVVRLLTIIFQTLVYEEPQPYGAQFAEIR